MQQNYAFIDAQNLNSGLYKLGWKIDWKRFREYLREEAGVEVAYVFLGFMLGNQDLYLMLQRSGFVVVFKEILTMESGEVKGNIDAELILQAMIDYDRYDKALIVSGDGDFTCLLRYLGQNNKLLGVLAPYEKGLSSLIQKVAEGKIEYLRSLRKKIEYRPVRDGRIRTGPKPPIKSDIGIPEGQIVPVKQKGGPMRQRRGNPKKTQNPHI
ncbi:MAG: NYN domain-containing protein [Candidatus Gracilibacteria bacterium]|nr:NYN domain-containing protein [Candidatus Gracilibacteria bacterium]